MNNCGTRLWQAKEDADLERVKKQQEMAVQAYYARHANPDWAAIDESMVSPSEEAAVAGADGAAAPAA
jgi:hypothetical protein